MKKKNYLMSLLILLLLFNGAIANDITVFSDSNEMQRILSVSVLEDKSGNLPFEKIIHSNQFYKVDGIPNLAVSSSSFWIKFKIKNANFSGPLVLFLEAPTIDEVELYTLSKENKITTQRMGETNVFAKRKYNDPNYIFDINLLPGEERTFLLKVRSIEQMMVPLSVGKRDNVQNIIGDNNLIFGLYSGIILVMFFYNLFVFFTVRDNSYLYYITYLLFIGLTQTSLKGYTFKYLWPNSVWLTGHSVVILSSLAAIAGMLFVRSFLLTSKHTPRLNRGLDIINGVFVVSIILSISGQGEASFKVMQLNTLFCSFYALFIGLRIAMKGYRPAKFFLLAWSILLGGAIIFVLKDFELIPFNRFTSYAVQIASALEAVLLSLALADRINTLKKENEQKQQEIIEHLKEKEKHLWASKEAELIVERLKKETLQSQFESLKSQVNPHFLFNSLNVLSELIYQNQDNAAKFVKELSDVYRYVLESRNKEVVELKSEIEFIESFIYLLKIRFSDNVELTINIKDEESIMIPPLTLQLLVENAVKHNVISKNEPLFINIYSGDNDYLVVRNKIQKKSGVQRSSGIGLKNIEARYGFFTDKKVVISDDLDFFTVYIPMLKFAD